MKLVSKSIYSALFCDSFQMRHGQIHLKPGKDPRSIHMEHAYSIDDFKKLIKARQWDVVFIPTYWNMTGVSGEQANSDRCFSYINEIPEPYRPKLIIYHGLDDQFKLLPRLKAIGLLVKHVPWIQQRDDTKADVIRNNMDRDWPWDLGGAD